MNHWIRSIAKWWRSEHPPCAKIPGWRAAYRAEKRALAAGCTQALHKAREGKQAALHDNLRGLA